MRRLSLILLLATALAAPLAAQGQQPPPTAQPSTIAPNPQQPPPAGQRGGGRGVAGGQQPTTMPPAGRGMRMSSQNIRLDVNITDSADRTQKKLVSMLVADREAGRIRSSNNVGVLNVDGSPWVEADGRIKVWLTIEYMPDRSATTTNLNQSITLVVTEGKPTLISQSADPGTDRKVSVEITATVVK